MFQLVPTGPFSAQPLTGTRGRGLTYQRRVGRVLEKHAQALGWELLDHWWLRFPVGDGTVWKQPDFILISPASCAIVFEAKLTWVDCTFQLQSYTSLLAQVGYSAFGVTVCRNLTPVSPAPVIDFHSLRPDCTWHLFL